MSKLWQKTTNVNELVENFTVGRDREFDEQMAAFDVLGSLAHTRMLQSIGLMDEADLKLVQKELKTIYKDIQAGNFSIGRRCGRCAFAGGTIAYPTHRRCRQKDP